MGDAGWGQGVWHTVEIKQIPYEVRIENLRIKINFLILNILIFNPMKDGSEETKGFYSLTFNGQIVYILEMTTVQPLNNLYLSLGDPNFSDANSKIRNIVIAEAVTSNN